MWQFSKTIDGLAEACTALARPSPAATSASTTKTLGKSIYPTPVIGVLGILDDASRVLKIAFPQEGDLILLLDGANPSLVASAAADCAIPGTQREFSSSEYSKTIAGIVAGEPPAIDLGGEKRLQDCLIALAAEGASNPPTTSPTAA